METQVAEKLDSIYKSLAVITSNVEEIIELLSEQPEEIHEFTEEGVLY